MLSAIDPPPSPIAPVVPDGDLIRPWQWPNLLALDAPLVALGWMALLAKMQGLSPRMQWLPVPSLWAWNFICLGGAVWSVYLADRLLDSIGAHAGTTARHRFALRHRVLLAVLFAGSTALAAYAAFWRISAVLLPTGWILAQLLLVYGGILIQQKSRRGGQAGTMVLSLLLAFVTWTVLNPLVHSQPALICLAALTLGVASTAWVGFALTDADRPRLRIPKKLFAGYLFAAGCGLIPLVSAGQGPEVFGGDAVLMLAVLAAMNLLLLSRREAAGASGQKAAKREQLLLTILFWGGCALCLACAWQFLGIEAVWARRFAVAVAGSSVLLALLQLTARRFDSEIVRGLADAALLTPWLAVAWPAA